MRGHNFVSFLTVQGFIISIVFGILHTDTAEALLGYVILISFFFYMFAHICIGFYYHTLGVKAHPFPKQAHERHLDAFVREINKREQFIDAYYMHKEELIEDHDRRKA